MKKLLFVLLFAVFLVGCGSENGNDADAANGETEEEVDEIEPDQDVIEPTEIASEGTVSDVEDEDEVLVDLSEEELEEVNRKIDIFDNLLNKLDNGQAFDAGSYIPGDIPEGEYVFANFEGGGQYYAEKELNGDIIDNENFDSFGYVHVHEEGNIETRGILISVDDLDDIGVSGAKEIYEILNSLSEYNESGWYKVGVDIDPGEYVIESNEGDSAYVAVMSGPVGNSSIINNENFDGRFAVNVQEGQYLKISRGSITD